MGNRPLTLAWIWSGELLAQEPAAGSDKTKQKENEGGRSIAHECSYHAIERPALQRLQILHQRPAVLVGEVHAVLVSGVEVAAQAGMPVGHLICLFARHTK